MTNSIVLFGLFTESIVMNSWTPYFVWTAVFLLIIASGIEASLEL